MSAGDEQNVNDNSSYVNRKNDNLSFCVDKRRAAKHADSACRYKSLRLQSVRVLLLLAYVA